MTNTTRAWGLALAACVPLLATAQVAKSEPPKAAPQLTYLSAFADYKPYMDAPPGDWRALNAEVAGAGGHAGHGMGAMGNMGNMGNMGGMKGMEGMKGMGGMKGMEGMEGMKGMEMHAAPAAAASAPMQVKPAPKKMPMTTHDGHQGQGDKP